MNYLYASIAVIVVLAVVGLLIWRRRGKHPEAEEEHQMLSFVALLREPQYVEGVILATAARKAWDADLGDGSEDGAEGEDGFAVGQSPSCVIRYRQRMLLINSFPTPYVDNPEAEAEIIADLRLRELFASHQAWLSCDAMGVESFDDLEEVREWYRLLGRLLSELVDENCLAIYLPQTQQIFANMEETLEMLKSDDPLAALQEDAPVPVMQISENDPRMQAAVAEARERWPEFEAAFRKHLGDNFGVKAPITVDGNTEFIWLEVSGVEDGIIYGQLANEPINLGSLKLGSRVQTRIDDLNDWAYTDPNQESHGLFTVRVLAEAEQQRQRDLESEENG